MLLVYRRWCQFIKETILLSASQPIFHKKDLLSQGMQKAEQSFYTQGTGNKVSWQLSDLHKQRPKAVQVHRPLFLARASSFGGRTLKHIAEDDFKYGVQGTSLKIRPCQDASLGALKITSCSSSFGAEGPDCPKGLQEEPHETISKASLIIWAYVYGADFHCRKIYSGLPKEDGKLGNKIRRNVMSLNKPRLWCLTCGFSCPSPRVL